SAMFDNSATITPEVSNITIDDFGSIISNNSNTIIPNDSSSGLYDESEHDVQSDTNLELMMYDLDELNEIITKKFEDAEIFDDPVNLALEVELSQDILSEFSLD
ncbi:32635_t:CDS:1, partial [Racocetra persica]